jgi:ABC-type phosphate/phosphonate transport system permease subunit
MRDDIDMALRQRNAMMRLTMAINRTVPPLILALPVAAASPAPGQNPPCYQVTDN